MKKNGLKKILAIVLVAALACGVAVYAGVTMADAANTPTVTFDDAKRAFAVENAGVTTADGKIYYDLFSDMKNLMPGDQETQKVKVQVKNLQSTTNYVKISVKATDTANTDPSLLAANGVSLAVKTGETDITGSLATGVVLGTFYSAGDSTMDVTLNLPLSLGNEYQDAQSTLHWVFTAEVVNKSGGGHHGGGDIDIDDPDVPLNPGLNTTDHYAYIIGRDDGLIHPEAQITRGEVATIFFRMLTDESRTTYWAGSNPYLDVTSGTWCNNAISTLSKAGILKGYEDGTFHPYASITRAEFAAIAVRFFEVNYQGEDLFSDISTSWARNLINGAAATNLIKGYEDGTFRPANNITRAEAITIMNRVLERTPVKEHLMDAMIQWPDNQDTGAWYYTDVQEATNSHTFDLETDPVTNETYEVWNALQPVRDWSAFEKEWSNANSAANPGEIMVSTDSDGT